MKIIIDAMGGVYITVSDEEYATRGAEYAAYYGLASLEELDCIEARYFMDNFLSSFNMTLDELQN